jgi:gamma-glutamylcyclotransferase (GGCT)/AIG2-like uncharacterized protein YtfP
VLGEATGSLAADLALLHRWRQRLASEPPPAPDPTHARIHGECMAFDDPERRLPHIDALEGFRHGRPSLYQRVLVLTWVGEAARPAWTYVQPRPRGTPVPSGRWPE